MEIETKTRSVEYVLKAIQETFDEGERLTVEIRADSKGPVTVSAGYSGRAVSLPLASAHVVEPGVVYADNEKLLKALSALPRCEIAISSVGNSQSALVYSNGLRMELPEDFEPTKPESPSPDAKCAVVETLDLIAAIGEVRHSTSAGYDRAVLQAVKIEIDSDSRLTAIATDGRRLSFCQELLRSASFTRSAETGIFEALLPLPAVRFIAAAPHGERTSIFVEKDVVTIRTGSSVGMFRGAVSHFPKWRDVVPGEVPVRAALPCDELSNMLRALLAFRGYKDGDSSDYMPGVAIDCSDGRITLMSPADSEVFTRDCGKFSASVPWPEPADKPFRVLVNAKYLLDTIETRGGSVVVSAKEGSDGRIDSPLLMRFPSEPAVTEVLMPLRAR